MDKQSVRIGVDMLFYALLSADSASALTYMDSVPIEGVTEVIVTKNSGKVIHRSDDRPSEVITQDGNTSVSIQNDGLTSAVKAAILGTTYSSASGLYQEGIGEVAPYLALGYRSKKANGFYKYTWFLKGACSKISDTSQVLGETITVQQDLITFFAVKPRYYASQTYGLKNSYHSDDENAPSGLTDALLAVPETGWFSSPLYVPVAPGTAISDLAGATGSGAAGTMALTFTAPAGMTSAYVQVRDPLGTEWVRVSTTAAITAVSTSAEVVGLTAGNTYDVRLVVVGGSKNGISNVDEDVVAHS